MHPPPFNKLTFDLSRFHKKSTFAKAIVQKEKKFRGKAESNNLAFLV